MQRSSRRMRGVVYNDRAVSGLLPENVALNNDSHRELGALNLGFSVFHGESTGSNYATREASLTLEGL